MTFTNVNILVLIGLLEYVSASNILVVFPIPSISHQIAPRRLWAELSRRGHKVTLITTNPVNDPALTNLTEIDISFLYDIWKEANITKSAEINDSLLTFYQTMTPLYLEASAKILALPEVQALIHGDAKFDLLIAQFVVSAMFGFQHRFQCPFIGMYTLPGLYPGHLAMGNPTHPILYPDPFVPFRSPMSILEKFQALYLYYFLVHQEISTMGYWDDRIVREQFGEGYPSISEIKQNVDVMFINELPALHPVRPVVAGTIYIGGGLHLTDPKPLPKELKQYLDNAIEGVIYFSLGTNIISKDIAENVRRVIMDTFKELPYKVLWKYEQEHLDGKPDNVKLMKWTPQQDILRHPNIKLFIMQGGLQSIEEALFNHVPLVVMPYFADQELNARCIEEKGFGIKIHHNNLEKEHFKRTILEVINNAKYRMNAKAIADLARDEPMTVLEKTVWWTEYVIRNKGAKHLKSPALSIYEYLFLDILAVILATIILLSVVTYYLFKIAKYAFCKFCGELYRVSHLKMKLK